MKILMVDLDSTFYASAPRYSMMLGMPMRDPYDYNMSYVPKESLDATFQNPFVYGHMEPNPYAVSIVHDLADLHKWSVRFYTSRPKRVASVTAAALSVHLGSAVSLYVAGDRHSKFDYLVETFDGAESEDDNKAHIAVVDDDPVYLQMVHDEFFGGSDRLTLYKYCQPWNTKDTPGIPVVSWIDLHLYLTEVM